MTRIACGLVVCLLALSPGCAKFGRIAFPRTPCRATVPFRALPPEPPLAPPPSTEPHPDYARLRPFRSYISLERVGPFAHHFRVFYFSVETGYCEVEILPGPSPHAVSIQGCGFGLLQPPAPEERKPIPAELASFAEAASSALCASNPSSQDLLVTYLGAYRDVQLHEAVPYTADGHAGIGTHLRLRTTEALEPLEPPMEYQSGFGALFESTAQTPVWIPFAAPPELAGQSLLFAYARSPAQAPFWPELEAQVRATARAIQSGAPLTKLDALPSAQGSALLPPGIENQALAVELWLYARGGDDARLLIPLRTRDAVFGVARGRASATLKGLVFEASAELRSHSPVDPAAVAAERRLPMTLSLELNDGRGHSFQRTFELEANAFLERGVAALAWLEWRDLNATHADELKSFTFPGHDGVEAFGAIFYGVRPAP